MAVDAIGNELRQERLRQAMTLDDISERTRISLRALEAIEADEFDRLPGLVFTRNFVRLYALELKLDPDALVTRLPRIDIESAPMPNPPDRPSRNAWDPRLTAALASALWLVTAAGAGTGAWYYFNHFGRHLITTVAAAPAPERGAQAKPAKPGPVLASAESPNAALPNAASPDTNAQNTAATAIAPADSLDGNRPVQVILTAHDVVWLQVSADGRTAFVGLLHPNETRTVAADDQVKILTGNAGGLDISLNGKPLDPLGPRGQIRTVRLTAEGPQFGPQNPPASSPL